jgi:hypothetical protein
MSKTETTEPDSEELFALAQKVWLEVKPSKEAQRIRSALTTKMDSGKYPERDFDYVPDYVWLLVDIAAQRGLDYVKN